jgi:hypothetical protein
MTHLTFSCSKYLLNDIRRRTTVRGRYAGEHRLQLCLRFIVAHEPRAGGLCGDPAALEFEMKNCRPPMACMLDTPASIRPTATLARDMAGVMRRELYAELAGGGLQRREARPDRSGGPADYNDRRRVRRGPTRTR